MVHVWKYISTDRLGIYTNKQKKTQIGVGFLLIDYDENVFDCDVIMKTYKNVKGKHVHVFQPDFSLV